MPPFPLLHSIRTTITNHQRLHNLSLIWPFLPPHSSGTHATKVGNPAASKWPLTCGYAVVDGC